MAQFERDQTRIHYQVHGEGFPLLAIAPGGLRSHIGAWQNRPIVPSSDLAGSYRVITMDQRNAGTSWAPISAQDDWRTYTADQLALLDHVGAKRFHVIGMCIGGAHIMSLIKAAPERVASAVLLQPIGLENNRQAFIELADSWWNEIRPQHPEATDADYASFVHNMFGSDFVFSASPADVAACQVPLLVLLGNDLYHPPGISRRVAHLAPQGSLIEEWKEGPAQRAALERILAFLAQHSSQAA